MYRFFLRSCVVRGSESIPYPGRDFFSVAFDDPLNQLATVQAQVEQHVVAAGQRWAGHLIGSGTIEVLVRTSTSVPFAEGRSFTSNFVHPNGAFNVFEQGMTAEIRTGQIPTARTTMSKSSSILITRSTSCGTIPTPLSHGCDGWQSHRRNEHVPPRVRPCAGFQWLDQRY